MEAVRKWVRCPASKENVLLICFHQVKREVRFSLGSLQHGPAKPIYERRYSRRAMLP